MMTRALGFLLFMSLSLTNAADDLGRIQGEERQVTMGPGGRILTNINVWSPDSQWLIYDIRSDPTGEKFDGSRIEAIHVDTGEIRILYESIHGAHCGVATHHPREPYVAFILGPEHPTTDWQYGPNHRQGVVVDTRAPRVYQRMDAREMIAPPTPGALRGGTHVHVWDAVGEWISYTYNDAVVEPALRDIGIAVPGHQIKANPGHPRNHDGEWFCSLVTTTVPAPKPGSDEIKRANEEGWIGNNGYLRSNGTRQTRALAFQGHVTSLNGENVVEVFVVDLPDEISPEALKSAELTPDGRLQPLTDAHQRRLTQTTGRKYPGVQGPRHWLRSSPDGSMIACLMKDDEGVAQIWTVNPGTGELKPLTTNKESVTSAFSWSSDGRWIAHGLGGRVCLTDSTTGKSHLVVGRDAQSGDAKDDDAIRQSVGEMQKEACVISPDGSKIAFVRSKTTASGSTNQICVVELGVSLGQ